MREIELADESVIRAEENFDLPDDAGAVVWDAGLVMAYYLIHSSAATATAQDDFFVYPVKNRFLVEIGSGPGLVGLVAAGLGAQQVILTDLPHLLPSLDANIKLNELEGVAKGMELTWGEAKQIQHVLAEVHQKRTSCAASSTATTSTADSTDSPPSVAKRRTPDIVLASDCVYKMLELDDLLVTIAALLRGDYTPQELEEEVDLGFEEPVCLLSFEDREGADGFLEELERHGLKSCEIPSSYLHPDWRAEDIHIRVIRRIRSKNHT